MQVEEIRWLDKDVKEAFLKISSGADSLWCFSCPCSGNVGDIRTEPLECLDAENIIMCDNHVFFARRIDDKFKYVINGRVVNRQNGLVEVNGFLLHLDEDRIPKDITDGMFIQFIVSRIDIW